MTGERQRRIVADRSVGQSHRPDHDIPKQASQRMSAATCPDNETLKSLLLGKLTGSQLSQWEEHLLHCQSCAATAETLDGGDALTEAIVGGNFPSGDEEVLHAAIEQAKRLSSALETVQIDETLASDNSLSQASSFESQKSRYKLDFLAPAEQPDELGRLGDYRVLKVLGVGGMGMVFKAEDIRLGRLVALKVMRPGIAAKRDAKSRFLREARATAALSHDHVVQIHQVGEDRGIPFIAMQYLEGQSLQTAFTRLKKLRGIDVARIGKEVASGLAAAHEKGLIHRDIKPDNVWIEAKTRRAKILDFGLARDLTADAGLTQSGTILGTPRYMAPEQVTGENVDHRADLFSLGSMLYHLAAGQPPFAGSNIAALLFSITHSAPQPLIEVAPSIHPSLADLIMRLLSKEPENRPQSAEAVAKQFAKIESAMKSPANTAALPAQPSNVTKATKSADRRPPTRPWPMIAAAGAAAFALLLGVIVITIRGSDGKETEIQVAAGTTTTLDLAPGSEIVVQEQRAATPADQVTDQSKIPTAPQPTLQTPAAPSWQPTPEQQAFFDEVAALPAKEQAAAVAKKLQEINPGFDGEFEYQVEEDAIAEYKFLTANVSKVWPVRALPKLKRLDVPGIQPNVLGKLKDLSPLRGMKLNFLNLSTTSVSELSPLAGMPLTDLDCAFTSISDLNPLIGMRLTRLRIAFTSVNDLTPLSGMPIHTLHCQNAAVSDFSPLRGMPLKQLWAYGIRVSDFSPLLGTPIDDLRFHRLLFCSSEEQVIRSLPVKNLGSNHDDWNPAAGFWKELDEQRAMAEKFTTETRLLPVDEQLARVEARLRELNNTEEINVSINRSGDLIESAVVQLTSSTTKITPIRAFQNLKKLTIKDGARFLDISPINNLPIEELICRQDQAMRNRLMLAEIGSLKTINGQPADQYLLYLQSLSESQAVPPPAAEIVPTEAETLAVHPPLDQWLKGREVLSVAQDGSAMHTTIQAALDAQKDGQVVQVLDKGPYREKLVWKNKQDCGLISTVDTVVLIPDEMEPTDPSEKITHDFTGLSDFRLHGFTFPYSPGKGSGYRGLINITKAETPCIESIVVMPTVPRRSHFYPGIWWTIDNGGLICLRDSVICVHQLAFNVPAGFRADVSRNWFRSLSGSVMCTSGVKLKHSSDIDATVLMANNITDRQCANSTELSSDFTRMHVTHQANTTVGRSGRTLTAVGLLGKQVVIENNLNLVNRNMCNFYGGSSSLATQAKQLWAIKGNYSNGINIPERSGDLPLGNPHATEIRLLSTDPLDRNFMRVDPTSITVPEGEPFPGALPPGPAPPEGDWFTELQDRFKDALQYMTPEAREFWSRPIELPTSDGIKKTTTNAVDSPAAVSVPEPTNPTPDDGANNKQDTEVGTDDNTQASSVLQANAEDAQPPQPEEPKRYAKTVRFNNDTNQWDTVRDYPPELERLKQDAAFQKMFQSAEYRYGRHEGQRELTQPPGFLVFGRVVSEDAAIDPQQIAANFPIAPDGHFVDFVPQAGTPIAVGLHAHHAIEVKPQGPPNPGGAFVAENLGTITLKRIERREAATVRGSIQLQDHKGRTVNAPAMVSLQVVPHADTDPNAPVRVVTPGKALANVVTPEVNNRGLFTALGLSPAPTTYLVTANREGFLPKTEWVRLKSGTSNPLVKLTLEQKIPIVIETIQWENENFDLKKILTAEMNGGENWQLSTPKRTPPGQMAMGGMQGMGGMGTNWGFIVQSDGKLTFVVGDRYRGHAGNPQWTGCKDLGEGTLADFANLRPRNVMAFEDQDLELKHNHVYLLRYCTNPGGYGPNVFESERGKLYLLNEASQYILSRVQILK